MNDRVLGNHATDRIHHQASEDEVLFNVKKWESEHHGFSPKLGKEYVKLVYCHPAYLTYMQSTS